MDFQDSSWNICKSRLVIPAASCGKTHKHKNIVCKNKQTNSGENTTSTTAFGVGNAENTKRQYPSRANYPLDSSFIDSLMTAVEAELSLMPALAPVREEKRTEFDQPRLSQTGLAVKRPMSLYLNSY